MPAPLPPAVRTHSPQTFLQQFLPVPAVLSSLLTPAAERFFIVPVERMYPHFTGPVPPVRATAHTLILLTSGTARIRIGSAACVAEPGEVLLVRAGQLHSFGPGDENTGLLCHFHDAFLQAGPVGSGAAAFG
ncbi:AraC family ligand binding domain-containing protein [Hymenobacter jeollabukensis]|uniref:AraC-type arabinose-binding/dimerisation domain-containing protein n=1 Tax=Hymenobacter jeollabukensis TaxID=2025313 RepID=A0A5R8WNG2_9BACT|nr:AraC family ligand binding domain-containing protein [Hymenobacter jeollabukensis]TLM91176.1 hypothetical protein FDY95_16410 [Hymenobacter jeollabukensis]